MKSDSTEKLHELSITKKKNERRHEAAHFYIELTFSIFVFQ